MLFDRVKRKHLAFLSFGFGSARLGRCGLIRKVAVRNRYTLTNPCGSLSDEAARAPRRPCPRQPGAAPARGSRLRARTRLRPGAPGCGPHGAAQICGPEVAA